MNKKTDFCSSRRRRHSNSWERNNDPATIDGNYSGVNASGLPVPLGQPRTVTVEIKAGEFLWFAEMEDNSGGISGMIIRGISSGGTTPVFTSIKLLQGMVRIEWTGGGTLEQTSALPADWSTVAGASSPYTTSATGATAFYRVRP